jgi:hypothetical protein
VIDHDGMFKLLLRTFFEDFLRLFFPELVAELQPGPPELIDKELWEPQKGTVDLLARVRLCDHPDSPSSMPRC